VAAVTGPKCTCPGFIGVDIFNTCTAVLCVELASTFVFAASFVETKNRFIRKKFQLSENLFSSAAQSGRAHRRVNWRSIICLPYRLVRVGCGTNCNIIYIT
jgi:hypothetical protein